MSNKLPFAIVALGIAGAIGIGVHGTSANHESACAAARLPIPSTSAIDLEERSYTLSFREEREGKVRSLDPPASLEIQIDGAAKPEVVRALDTTNTAVGVVKMRGIGHVEVTKAGRYTVRTSTPEARGELCIGHQAISDASLFMRCAGTFVLACLVAVGIGQLRRKDAPA